MNELVQATGFPNIRVETLDLCDFASIRTFCEKFRREEQKLDILICNAGIGHYTAGVKTKDGFDEMFQGNVLGHFKLITELTPLLIAAGSEHNPARIVNLSSLAAKFALSFDLQNYNNNNPQTSTQYPRTKLMNILVTRGFAKRLQGDNIVVHAVHPGTVMTDFANKFPPLIRDYILPTIVSILGRPLDQGAATQVYVASASEAGKYTGKYWSNMRITDMNAIAEDDRLVEDFMLLCDRLIR